MPVYLPWLTVIIAGLTALGALLAANNLSWFWLLLIDGLIFAACYFLKLSARLYLLLLVPLVFFGYTLWRMPKTSESDLSTYAHREIIFKAKVIDQVIDLSSGYRKVIIQPYALIFPERKILSGKAQLIILNKKKGSEKSEIKDGDCLKIMARIKLPRREHAPWQMSQADYLAKQSIFSTAIARSADIEKIGIEKNSNKISGLVEQLREKIVDQHNKNLGIKSGGLLSSMVLGERAVEVDSTIVNDFRMVGLSHLIAASGFNLTIVTAASYWLIRFFTQSKSLIGLFTILNMLTFVVLAGSSASVLRAALMCTILVIAQSFHRALHSLAALSLALLLTILIEPQSIADLGCQLSYAAVFGIICGVKALQELLHFSLEDESKKSKKGIHLFFGKWLLETILVVLCAQMAVMPIQLYYFWQFGLLFLPANLIVASFVTPVTILGFASSIITLLFQGNYLFDGLSWCFDKIAEIPLQAIISLAHYFASFEEAVLTPGQPDLYKVIFYYVAFIAFLISLKTKKFRCATLIILGLSGMILFCRGEQPLRIGVLPKSILISGSEHQGFIFGEESKQAKRGLLYSGASQGKQVEEGGMFFDKCRIKSNNVQYLIYLLKENALKKLEKGNLSLDSDAIDQSAIKLLVVRKANQIDKATLAQLEKIFRADRTLLVQNNFWQEFRVYP